ncbi:MAG TPA: peptidoglycan-binding protein [Candidatus Gallacutalibacter stercoravium]|nr:peptidoglycan-binding protein [Candidatus Gallacutalibacter stercoravium]
MSQRTGWMKKKVKAAVALLLAAIVVIPVGVQNSVTADAAGATGPGMAAYALNAYYSGWSYVYGGSSAGAVDCSGLIYSYAGGARTDSAQIAAAPQRGSLSSLPRIHGLGLHSPGHCGVYVGNGMAVDARNSQYGVVYQSVYSYGWSEWFKIAGVSYPDTGWVNFNGQTFYYQNGQYVVNVTLTIDGVAYTFGSDGALIGTPPANAGASYGTSVGNSVTNNTNNAVVNQPVNNTPSQPAALRLEVGMYDDRILEMKTRLNELNYYNAELTTYFGEFTGECVKNFQTDAGLEATGVVDQATWDAMMSDSAPTYVPTYTLGNYAEDIVTIETRLKELGYFYDEPTTYFGEDTVVAVSDFQAAAGLEVTGQADKATTEALYAEDAPSNPQAGTLKKNLAGDVVVELQNRLRELRYTTAEATSTFDDATEAAVKAYQAAAGLEQTGQLDKAALEILYSEDVVRSPAYDDLQLGYEGDDVAQLQENLTTLAYYAGEANGLFDESTKAAVEAFQTAKGLEVTGIVDEAVRDALDKALEAKEQADNDAKVSAVAQETVEQVLNSAPFTEASVGNRMMAAPNLGLERAAGFDGQSQQSLIWVWVLVGSFAAGGTAILVVANRRYGYVAMMMARRRKAKAADKVDVLSTVVFDNED